MGDALEVVPQLLLLEGQLRFGCEMLQSTPAAHAEMRTTRRHTLGRRPQHFQQPRFIMLSMLAGALEYHHLTGKGAGDEGGLPPADDPFAIVCETHDLRCLPLTAAGGGPDGRSAAHAPPSQTRRNSARCGSLPARSSTFTLSTSS